MTWMVKVGKMKSTYLCPSKHSLWTIAFMCMHQVALKLYRCKGSLRLSNLKTILQQTLAEKPF